MFWNSSLYVSYYILNSETLHVFGKGAVIATDTSYRK